MATDDEIIRKRLLLDGDGSGDEKRLVTFMKSFIKWCNNPQDDEISANATFERLLAMLATCQTAIAKNYLVYQMNKRELENYHNINKELTNRIKRAQDDIGNLKEELQEAKRTRRHQQEYDALGKVIKQHPNKEETTKILTSLESQEAAEKELDGELELRRKQLFVLVHAINQMKASISNNGQLKTETAARHGRENEK